MLGLLRAAPGREMQPVRLSASSTCIVGRVLLFSLHMVFQELTSFYASIAYAITKMACVTSLRVCPKDSALTSKILHGSVKVPAAFCKDFAKGGMVRLTFHGPAAG